MRTRLASWIVWTGVLLLVAGAGLAESLVAQWREWGGPVGLNKLSVNVDLAVDPSGSAKLTLRDAGKLAEKWGRPIAYSSRTLASVATKDRTVAADIIGVSEQYDRFANVRLHKGSTITAKSVEERGRVILLSERLAEKLFGTRNVTGMTVKLMGATFRIVGVYAEPDTLVGWMVDNGTPDAQIPITTLLELMPALGISTVELEAGESAVVSGESDVKAALTAIGKTPSRYRIVNCVKEELWIAQQPKLLLLAAGTAAIVLCMRLSIRRIRRAVGLVRRGLATDDWPDVVRKYRRELAFDAGATALLSAGTAGLLLAVRHRFYIPPELIPDEWINWAFYRQLWLDWWRERIGSMGYIASPSELLRERIGQIVTRLTFAGIVAGLPLTAIGVRMWAMAGLPFDGRFVRLSACVGTAVVLAAAAARWIGTDYVVRPRELFVVGALLAAAALSAQAPAAGTIARTDGEAASAAAGEPDNRPISITKG
jgi:hypothetical protein